jgi:hypothetical protein
MARTDALMPVPAELVRGSAGPGALVEIPLAQGIPDMVLGMCTRTETRLSPLAAALARAIAEGARQLARAR